MEGCRFQNQEITVIFKLRHPLAGEDRIIMASNRRLAAIMFTDIAGYTALMQQSESVALRTRKRHRDVFEPTTLRYGGKTIQYYGDGTLSIFDSTVDAVRCALALQRRFRQEPGIPVRIGLHTGEILLTKDDIIGDSVNLASRVESLGVPGSVLLSEKVAEEIGNQEDLPVKLLGTYHFKNDGRKRKVFALAAPGIHVPGTHEMRGKLERPASKGLRRRSLAAIAALLLVAAIFATWRLAQKEPAQEFEHLAVLPFLNRTQVETQENLVDGLHEAVIAELQQAGIVVKARQSMLKYRHSDMPPQAIAAELEVEALIEGSVLRADDTLALNLSLIDAHSGNVIWNSPFQADFSKVFDLYGEITRKVAQEIHQALDPATESRLNVPRQVNADAYKAYLKGQHYWNNLTRESLTTAMEFFELAREIDPNYAPAYAGIAAVWIGRKTQGFVSDEEAYPPLEQAMENALRLGSKLQEVQFWYALHTWLRWDWEAAEAAFLEALKINPNYAEAHAYYSHFLLQFGENDDKALWHLEKAVELDPFNSLFRGLYGMGLNFTGQYDKVIDWLNETLRTAPNDPIALSTLRTSYHLVGEYDKALDIWKRFHLARNDSTAVATMEGGYAEGGYPMALQRMAELLIERSSSTYVPPWQIATLYTRAGQEQLALDWLERALPTHDPNFAYIACDPIFDYMRDNPRFMRLMVRIGLDPGLLSHSLSFDFSMTI